MTVFAPIILPQVAQRSCSRLDRLGALLLLLDLQQQCAVDMWQNTSESDGGFDERVELFVAANSELKMARCDALDFEILGGVACELKHFGGQIFENGGQVDAGFGADARLLACDGTKVTLYATAGELWQNGQIMVARSKGSVQRWLRGVVGQ